MLKLYPHQIEAQEYMVDIENDSKGGVLAHAPGCGKTICMIWYMREWKTSKPDLIVCPLSVLGYWEREILRVFDAHDDYVPSILVYHGTKRDSDMLKRKWDFIITTYAVMTKGELQKRSYERIVLDEAHVIKNGTRSTKPSKCAQSAYALKSVYKWCLTGTPFNNSIMDLASLAKFIGTKPYNDIEWWKNEANNPSEWTDLYVLLKTKDDLLDKPIYKDIVVKPTMIEKEIIDQLRNDAAVMFNSWKYATGIDKITLQGTILGLISHLRQCSNSCYCGDKEISISKIYQRSSKIQNILKVVTDRVKNDPSKSVVIFSQFVSFLKVIERCLKLLYDNKLEIYKFTGDMSIEKRDSTVKAFTTRKAPRVLLISLMAGGVGLNLTPCSSIVLSEPWYNPFVEKQAEDRVHRLGQLNQVYVYRFTMENSVETWIQGIKMGKFGIAEELGLDSGDGKPKIEGISSTFNMSDLNNLFTSCVGFNTNKNK
jgi:transcription termination factor 2